MNATIKYLLNINEIKNNLFIFLIRPAITQRNYYQKDEVLKKLPVNSYTTRSHTCGELTINNVGQEVSLCGWLQYERMNQFAVLRDAYGTTQILLPDNRKDLIHKLQNTSLESVITVKGTVEKRPQNQINHKMATGEIEIIAQDFQILNNATKQLPFTIRNYQKANEMLRMKYRYLALRFPDMQNNLRIRSKILMKMRNFLANQRGFVEIETPTLFKKTPGGAQEFIVPTQASGDFYSLVQSPQQLKQLLMVGGMDRYFQIARCYRDETSRPDRQPEFTQLDMELSFTDADGVMNLTEDVLEASLTEETEISKPFKKLSFKEALENYGTDQPDLTIIPQIHSLKNILLPNDVEAKFLKIPGAAPYLKKTMKEDYLKIKKTFYPDASLNILKNSETNWDKYSKNLKGWDGDGKSLRETLGMEENDIAFISIGPKLQVLKLLGKLRSLFVNALREMNLTGEWESKNPSQDRFVWIVDFPLFEVSDTGCKLESMHHPFTSPHSEDMHLLDKSPLEVRGLHYDLVMNGWEIGGGSVRIHNADLQIYVLKELLRIPTEDLSHLINGLESGAPPHAGIALGIDRLISLIVGAKSIRDVIAFPKSSEGRDLMTGAPCPVSSEELKLYNIQIVKENKNEIVVKN